VLETEGENFEIREFKETEAMTTYLFCFMAGPYAHFVCEKKHRDTIQIRNFVPKNQKETFAKIENDWNRVHLFALDYLEHLLGTNYPYSKYDSHVSPITSFLMGAAEMSGNILWSPDRIESNWSGMMHLNMYPVAWHEMGHMWFGN